MSSECPSQKQTFVDPTRSAQLQPQKTQQLPQPTDTVGAQPVTPAASDCQWSRLLDEHQLEAVQADIHTPLLILAGLDFSRQVPFTNAVFVRAGPGSGKTTTLCYRIVYMIEVTGRHPF